MIILDNTALSALAHIDRLDIPLILFGDTHIPECVYYEGVLKAKKSKRVDRIKKCIENGQIKVIKSTQKDIEYAESLPTALGPGERYAIAIGISEKCLTPIFVKCLCPIIEPWPGYPKAKFFVA
jgi:predicted nucleic acid-binding protein